MAGAAVRSRAGRCRHTSTGPWYMSGRDPGLISCSLVRANMDGEDGQGFWPRVTWKRPDSLFDGSWHLNQIR